MTTPDDLANTFTLKAHDTLPIIQATLTDGTGSPPPLGTPGTAVWFIMAQVDGPMVFRKAAVIVDVDGGVVQYRWVAADTATPGTFQAEWEVTYPAADKQTFPTETYHVVRILADLDGA
jgi:hypothetical protein